MGEWISVDERLPDKNGRYLIYHISDLGTPMIDVAGFTFEYGWAAGFRFNLPTYWMPLPDPPKEQK